MEITIFYKTNSNDLPEKPKSDSLEDLLFFEKIKFSFVIYELKNNKLYFKKEKISNNFKKNESVLLNHYNLIHTEKVESIYHGNDKTFSTNDFEQHIKAVEDLNKKIKLNKLR